MYAPDLQSRVTYAAKRNFYARGVGVGDGQGQAFLRVSVCAQQEIAAAWAAWYSVPAER